MSSFDTRGPARDDDPTDARASATLPAAAAAAAAHEATALSAGAFRKFRQLLMAKQLETRGDTFLAEVLPGALFIGSFGAAGNREELERLGISHVVCVSASLPLQFPETIEYLRLSVADVPTARISESFSTAFTFIDSALANDGKVLVHCYLGRSRSATIVLAYLVARRNMSLEAAAKLLRNVRPQIQPNSGFWSELQELEKQSREVAAAEVRSV